MAEVPGFDVLLAHRDFLRALAARLVSDKSLREDAVQQALLRAIERPPRGDPRSWLARVLRNLASSWRREARRRTRREQAAARPEALPSVEEVAAEEELRRQVVDAVLKLDEPYRSTVLLHYYEGIAPRALARRLGVAEATVRTRLFRAHSLLRRTLGATKHREPGEPDPKLSVPAGLSLRWLSSLVTLMSTKKPLAACIALAFLGWLWLELASPPPAGVEVGAQAPGLAAPDEGASPPPVAAASRHAALAAAAPASSAGPPVFPADRVSGELQGVVVDDCRDPVPSVRVRLASTPGNLPFGFELGDDRDLEHVVETDAAGRFRFAGIPSGPYRATATASDGRQASLLVAAAPDPNAPIVLELREDQAQRLRVRVETEAGLAVPAARVEVIGNVPGARRTGMCGMEPLVATTDANGECVFDGPVDRSSLVTAIAPSGMAGRVNLWGPTHELRVRVAARGSIEATLTGLPEDELATVTVSAWAMCLPGDTYGWQHGVEHRGSRRAGVLVFDDLPPGHYELLLAPGSSLRLVLPQMVDLNGRGQPLPRLANSVRSMPVEVRPGQVARTHLTLGRAGRVAGRVRDERDRPVAGARVRATFAPPRRPADTVLHGVQVWRLAATSRSPGFHPAVHVESTTDASGRYALAGLQPGRHRLEVLTDRLSHDRREGVEVAAGETTELEHRLEPSGVLQGIVRSVLGATWVALVRAGADSPGAIAIAPNGQFTFPGLAAGCYTVCELRGEHRVPWVELGRAEVTAGRTTWVDLRDAPAAVELVGVLTGVDGPVAGAIVEGASDVTGLDGVFCIRSSFPGERGSGLRAHIGPLTYGFALADELAATTRARAPCRLGPHTLRVEAIGRSGELAPALLALRSEGDWKNPEHVTGRLRLAAGTAELRHLWPGSYLFSVSWPSGYACHGKLRVPEQRELAVVEQPVGEVDITLGDDLRRSSWKWSVAAWTWRGEGPAPADFRAFQAQAHSRGTTTHFDGRCLLRGVVAGRVLVVATPMDDPASDPRTRLSAEARELATRRQRLTLRAGERGAVQLGP